MLLKIRPEVPADYQAISRVNELAFEQPNEGKLIEKLRINPDFVPELSLVAEVDGKVVGYILFFPIKIKTAAGKEKETLSLAPVAVLPGFQKKGIGSELITQGLQTCMRRGYHSVTVLGHPEYYPKFGFKKADKWRIKIHSVHLPKCLWHWN